MLEWLVRKLEYEVFCFLFIFFLFVGSTTTVSKTSALADAVFAMDMRKCVVGGRARTYQAGEWSLPEGVL